MKGNPSSYSYNYNVNSCKARLDEEKGRVCGFTQKTKQKNQTQ